MIDYKMQMCKDIGKELNLRPESVRYTCKLLPHLCGGIPWFTSLSLK